MSLRMDESYRKEIEILRILSEHKEPMGSTLLQRELARRGFLLGERTVRYHLQLLEERGLLKSVKRDGRVITERGLEELSRSLAYEKVGFVVTRHLSLAYRVGYDLENRKGNVVANVSITDEPYLDDALEIVRQLKKAKVLPAPYLKVLRGDYGDIHVPEGKVAIFTVCNLTIDGVLMHAGIPLILKYGGLVQFVKYKPVRFVELISHEGTTIPPLEVFVYRRLTSVTRFLETGSGMIPANLREVPAEARGEVKEILNRLKADGWGGIVAFGKPNESVLGVPVAMDRCGISMAGGLIPLAALAELNIPVETFAPHCLMPIEDMERIED